MRRPIYFRTIIRILFAGCAGVFLPVAVRLQAQAPCAAETVLRENRQRFPQGIPPGQDKHPLKAGYRNVAHIPVVVHVVYKGNLENISDDQIHSQIAVLNQDYRRLNPNAGTTPPFFAPLAADVELEFCLASTDPSGSPTKGITRRETVWNNIGQLKAPDGRPRIYYTELGGEDAWLPEHYLNIWVCSIGGGILGYGTYPGTAPPAEDGVVIDPRYFGTTGLAVFYPPHHLGRTATHEIGHYFNLLHIWGGDENICTDDDDVADTPVQRSAFLGCPVFPQFSCGNSAMFMNYMDYTDDACMSLFTLGQKNRIWAALNTVRAGLLDSSFCISTAVNEPAGASPPLQLYPNPLGGDNLYIAWATDQAEARWSITDPGGRIRLTGQVFFQDGSAQVEITSLTPGIYTITLTGASQTRTARFIRAVP